MSMPPPDAYRRGVGLMLLNHADHVFVAQRLDNPGDAWQMPQGGIDAGEEPGVAVFREMREEIGTDKAEIIAESRDWLTYDLPAELIPRVWGGKYRGQKQKWYAMRFVGRDDEINISTEHPEFSSWKWVPADQIVDLIVPFKRDLYQAVLTEFAAFLKR